MTAYYNEFAPYVAAWLRNLIRAADKGPRLRFVERQMQHQGEAA